MAFVLYLGQPVRENAGILKAGLDHQMSRCVNITIPTVQFHRSPVISKVTGKCVAGRNQ